jgi:hypothetical protein
MMESSPSERERRLTLGTCSSNFDVVDRLAVSDGSCAAVSCEH